MGWNPPPPARCARFEPFGSNDCEPFGVPDPCCRHCGRNEMHHPGWQNHPYQWKPEDGDWDFLPQPKAVPAMPRIAPARPAPLWKCMCDGCGAPLQRNELQCSYCRRATMAEVDIIDCTTIDGPAFVAAGVLSPNEARHRVLGEVFIPQPSPTWK